jgi:hypothetical protein
MFVIRSNNTCDDMDKSARYEETRADYKVLQVVYVS